MAYLEITGTVTDTRWDGKLVILKEEYEDTFKGETTTRKRLWNCWFDAAPNIQVNDQVRIAGNLKTKIGTWDKKQDNGQVETRQIVEHHLQDASLRISLDSNDFTF